MQSIYLDNNSTTAVLPQVIEVMNQCYHAQLANPASSHHLGSVARKVIEEARDTIGESLGANITKTQADRIIFTSGTTEANNLILRGLKKGSSNHAIISAIEHPSVMQIGSLLASQGWQIDILPVSREGIVRIDQLLSMFNEHTRFVSIMLANNETGAIQPIKEAASICREKGVVIHTDAAQAVGKVPVNFVDLDVDAMTFTAHKLHGPCGIGALIVRHNVSLEPLLYGGFQQEGLRPGTETPALAVGFRKAIEISLNEFEPNRRHLLELQNSFEDGLLKQLPDLVVHAKRSTRLPNTCNVAFPQLNRQQLLMALDMQGIACSTGSACASGSSDPSHVLVAMGCDSHLIEGSLRFSFSVLNSKAEIQQAAGRIIKVVQDLRKQKSG